MKVLLINPVWTTVKGYEDSIRVPLPVGLAYIASYLRANGIEVRVIDALAEGWRIKQEENGIIRIGLPIQQIVDRVCDYLPDMVGISCMFTSQSNNLHELAGAIKNAVNLPIVVGGAHASAVPHSVLKDSNIDYVVRGEGEQTMLDLTCSLNDVANVKGICYRQKGNVVYSEPQPPIIDMDSLPLPAYDLFPMDEYFQSGRERMSPRSSIQKKWMSIVISRGCPFKCNFCSVHTVMGRTWRARSHENVIHEIEYLKITYGIEHIFFEDDNLTFNTRRAGEIFNEMVGMNLTWETPNGIRADRITPELVDTMKRSGCKRLTIAVESGSQDFLQRVIKKNMNLKELENAVGIIRAAGIDLAAFYILGIPGETEKTAAETISFSRKLARKGVRPYINIAVPLAGTDMYNDAKAKGYLVKEKIEPIDYLMAMQKPLLRTEHYDGNRLLEWRKKAMRLALMELLLHCPSALLKSETFSRLRTNPLSILRNAKIFSRGTC